ncbi:RagB/SusD family nutrient uptake outer membrane protein [Puteibacter caeruleilacunae]|nr:RagB/SusD family nutrient uptake outer membrane protein [Puteibacter caeruleilacunae]
MKQYTFKIALLLGILITFNACDDVLEKNPLDKLSDQSFWNSENDAKLALAGVYAIDHNMWGEGDWWSYRGLLWLEFASDNAYDRRGNKSNQSKLANGLNVSTNGAVKNYWTASYKKIGRCNNFLENIVHTEMDENLKAQMIAEVRFIRACQYFYMCQYWGGVPLVTKVQTIEEANNVTRASKADIVSFVRTELSEAVSGLPSSRPTEEKGRVTKAAALAFLGRLQMAEQQWGDAANTFKQIIDLGEYQIDDRYEELFLTSGETSKEIIWASQVLQDDLGHAIMQHFLPYIAGGWHIHCPLNEIVDAYDCVDGLPISQSPLYDASKPFENRDPRLAMSVLLPNTSTFNGVLYVTHPDSTKAMDRVPNKTKTGYGLRKYNDENYDGDTYKSGNDVPIIRYAEVLLSYLEAMIESGASIDQALLDATINKIRGRAAVNLPAITETNPDALRTLLRNERRVELAFEGIRYWDLLRWNIAHEVMTGKFYGAKIADGPSSTSYVVNDNGNYFVTERAFRKDVDYLWPIPQAERDINDKLEQNPGY